MAIYSPSWQKHSRRFAGLKKKKDSVNPSSESWGSIKPKLWREFFKGSRLACARLISQIENYPELAPVIRDKLIPHQKGAVRVGITGPPGVGKSTVTAALAQRARRAGRSVGVIAVDPTSPFTGGAFLGDRVRMQSLMGDPRVFIRSLASRDGHGGLSPSTPYVADVFDAFGMDRIFIETVGVGQAEIDVITCADIIILVLQPGTGDVIQALKAGIIEAADLFLINKADLPGAETLLDSLRFLFDISARPETKSIPPVLTASAVQDKGMDEVHAETERLIQDLVGSERYREKKRRQLEHEIRAAIQQNLWEEFAKLTNAREEIRLTSAKLLQNGESPYPYIRQTCARIRIELKDERTSTKDG